MLYRRKPIVFEVLEYTGDNIDDIKTFGVQILAVAVDGENEKLIIQTLEGPIVATKGDMIIKGINGEFHPCKPDIFEKTYEAVC